MKALQRFGLMATVPILATMLMSLWLSDRGYDTDLPLPTGHETYGQVLPETIAGIDRHVESVFSDAAGYRGARARYGEVAMIEMVQATSEQALNDYVREQLQPRLDRYPQRSSAKAGGHWRLQGSGPAGRLYGWQNRDWLFVIQAGSDDDFEEAIDRFAYIARR